MERNKLLKFMEPEAGGHSRYLLRDFQAQGQLLLGLRYYAIGTERGMVTNSPDPALNITLQPRASGQIEEILICLGTHPSLNNHLTAPISSEAGSKLS